MNKTVAPIPEGYRSITPYLIVKNAADAIAFYKKAFEAAEKFRINTPDGRVAHSEMTIGDSVIMLADECPEKGAHAPGTSGASPIMMHLYVKDVDKMTEQAIAAGAIVIRPVGNQFYGDRSGMLRDPFGHVWNLSTHIEDVSPEELHKRLDEMNKVK